MIRFFLTALFSALLLGDATAGAIVTSPSSTPGRVPTVEVLTAYDTVRAALAEYRDPDAVSAARALAVVPPVDPPIAAAAIAVAEAVDLPARRSAFGDLSRLLVQRLAGGDGPRVVVYVCPMIDRGYPYWVQVERGISNPYMGTSMPRCGEETSLRKAAKAAVAALG